jgi:hypothetical protein
MRTLSHLTLLTILTALLFACESAGGGSYGVDTGSTVPAADTNSSETSSPTNDAVAPQDTSTPTPEDAGSPLDASALDTGGSAVDAVAPQDTSTSTPEDAGSPLDASALDVPCAPDCTGKQCGDDGCGGNCGNCPQNEACDAGQCICVPSCVGKQCGSDDCGGSCGNCPNGEDCNEASGQCESTEPEPEPTVCDQYCQAVATNCTGMNALSWTNDCATDCAGWPEGEDGDTAANTTHCRLYHAGAAAGDAALHCPHASPDGGGVCIDAANGLAWCEPNGGLYSSCSSDLDCNEGAYCEDMMCYLACDSDAQCDDDSVCLASIGFPQCYKTCNDDLDCCPGLGSLACYYEIDGIEPICVWSP